MIRYKCICSYDGVSYHGFQVQEGTKTIQGEIERVLEVVFKDKITIHASGRTDKGVHAINQVFHFDANIEIKPTNLRRAINSRLEKDIYLREITTVSDDFHSRHSAKSKEYHYLIDFGEYNPLNKDYRYYYSHSKFDKEKFKEAFNVYIGEHDFRSFTKASEKENTIRTIYSIEFEEKDTLLVIKIRGNGFLHNQIRILVAMALEVGMSKISSNDLKTILEAKNRAFAPKLAPAMGLYLYKVEY